MDEIKIVKTEDLAIDLESMSAESRNDNISNILEIFGEDENLPLLYFMINVFDYLSTKLGKIPKMKELAIKKSIELINDYGFIPIISTSKDNILYFNKRIIADKRIIAQGEEIAVKDKVQFGGKSYAYDTVYYVANMVYHRQKCPPIIDIDDFRKYDSTCTLPMYTYWSKSYAEKLKEIEKALFIALPKEGYGDPSFVMSSLIGAKRKNEYGSIIEFDQNDIGLNHARQIMIANITAILIPVLDRNKKAHEEFEHMQFNQKQYRKSTEYVSIMKGIVPQKIFAEIEEKLKRMPFLMQTPDSILELVADAKYRDAIVKTSKKRERIAEELKKGADWISRIRKIRNLPVSERAGRMEEYLSELLPSASDVGKGDSVVLDDVKRTTHSKKGEIICPHILWLIHHPNENEDNVVNALHEFIEQSDDRIFCKNCGEVISVISVFSEKMQSFSGFITSSDVDKNDPLFTNLLSVVGKVLTGFEFVNASKYDIMQFMINIRTTLYPHLKDIRNDIQKIRTQKIGVTEAHMDIYTAIYIYAYLMKHILNADKGSIILKFKEAPNAKDIKVLTKYFVRKMLSTLEIQISKINKQISPNILATRLVQAYGKLSITIKQVSRHQNRDLILRNTIANIVIDPYFRFLRLSSAGKSASAVLGWNLKDEKEIPPDVYQYSKIANSATENAKLLYEWVKNREYEKSLFSKEIKIPTFQDISSSNLEEWVSKYFKSEDIQENIRYDVLPKTLRKNARFAGGNPWASKYYPEQTLLRSYNEDGTLRKYNQWMTTDGKLLSIGDILDKIKNNSWKKESIKDIADTAGNTKGTLPKKDIREKVLEMSMIDDFSRFYENRCPEGGNHDYDKGEKCSKCGRKISMGEDEMIKYFSKYKDKYFKERDKAREFSTLKHISHLDTEQPISRFDNIESLDKKYKNWVANYSIINDITGKTKISRNYLYALGAFEGVPLSKIDAGEFIPKEPESTHSYRIYNLISIVQSLYSDYQLLINYMNIKKMKPYLHKIIEPYNPRELHKMIAKMPTLKSKAFPLISYFQYKKTPKECIDFILVLIAKSIAKIWNDSEKSTQAIRHDFANVFLDRLIAHEKRLTKPDYVSWNIIYGTDADPTEEAGNTSAEMDLGNYRDKYITDSMNEGEAGDTGEIMSTDVYDIEQEDGEDGLGDNDFNVEGID